MRWFVVILTFVIIPAEALCERSAGGPTSPTASPGALGADEVVPIEAGDRAPFSGQLFPTELAIRMGMRIERLELRLEADLVRAQELCAAETSFRDRLLDLERERYEHDTTELSTAAEQLAEQLEEARQVPWYRSWGFAFGMGVLASVLLVAGTAALAVSL